jgi:hypothetical protein
MSVLNESLSQEQGQSSTNNLRRDLQIPSVKEEINHYSPHYSARLTAHPNKILLTLLEPPERKRLRRHLPNDLPTRFMV